jgi:hypothetical protein
MYSREQAVVPWLHVVTRQQSLGDLVRHLTAARRNEPRFAAAGDMHPSKRLTVAHKFDRLAVRDEFFG